MTTCSHCLKIRAHGIKIVKDGAERIRQVIELLKREKANDKERKNNG